MGVHRGDRIATLAGHQVINPDNNKPPFWIHDWLENELFFSTTHFSAQNLPYIADELADFKPAIIRGYPSILYYVALYLLDTGREDIHPKAIFTSSETIFDFQRKIIEQAFDCKAYSYYSNAEVVAHLLQCKEGNFHVVTETCVVEVLNDELQPVKPGEIGEFVCTGLINRAMPLIRYRIGDLGFISENKCGCGLNTPIISRISGRELDLIVTPDGRHISDLDVVFEDTLNIKEAQVIQEDLHTIIVKIVPRSNYSNSKDEELIREHFSHRLGPSVKVELHIVDQIERSAGEKLHFAISKVPIQYEIRQNQEEE